MYTSRQTLYAYAYIYLLVLLMILYNPCIRCASTVTITPIGYQEMEYSHAGNNVTNEDDVIAFYPRFNESAMQYKC